MKPHRSSVFGAAAVLLLGLLTATVLIWTAPQTQPEEKTPSARVVQTMAISPQSHAIVVTAYGPVIPARKVVMRPEVRGRVVHLHPAMVPGGYLREGEELLRIDPADYELTLTAQEAAMEQAFFELEVEKGRQVVASREWQLLERDLNADDVNRSLVLREPHLRRTEALIRSATNEIARARLDLARTSVLTPFNARVLQESVEFGQLLERGTEICTLVGTDEFWVQATLSIGDLRRIRFPGPDTEGSSALIVLETGNGEPVRWRGSVARLLPDLDPTGRMARVLVAVPDPLSLRSQSAKVPLLLGSYVKIELDAGRLDDVIEIPRAAIREGDRIWVVDNSSQLRIRELEILWPRAESVLAANCLEPGEELVLSGLRSPLPGMRVDPQPVSPSEAPEPRLTNSGS